MSMFDDIKDFHTKFELEYKDGPRYLPAELELFRTKFMGEELAEYISPLKSHHDDLVFQVQRMVRNMRGMQPQSLEKQFDALIDLCYVALGTAYLQGFDFDAGWRRVHEANMKKVRALKESDSLRGSVYDVVKPEGWAAPDLSDLVREKPTMFTEYDPDCIPWN